ncbi:hypothetical protein PS874_01926 [Pseudomonas fluorescens]|nr:hypothetical protein PS874_01926 [Pseudomonas fluorescens]
MTAIASLDYGLVAFIDILGFSSMVEEDSKGKPPKFLPIFLEVFEEVADSAAGSGCDVKMFSDSIIVEAKLTPGNVVGLLSIAASMQKLFLKRNILVRGGIAFGKHFSSERVTFSQALINAYHLESKVAKFPRIVINDDVLNFAWHHNEANEEVWREVRSLVFRDRDNSAFVHYFVDEDLDDLKPFVQSYIEHNASSHETVLEKMRWLLDYYNYCASNSGGERLIIRTLERDFSNLDIIL